MNATCHDIIFESDGFQLKGTLHLPPSETPPVIIGVHGLQSDGNSPRQIALAEESNARGMAYFRFHHRGCGESEGIFDRDTSLVFRGRDIRNAVRCMREHYRTGNKIGLFGSSMGGAACISVARDVAADALVTLAAPVSSAAIFRHLEKYGATSELPAFFFDAHLQFDLSDVLSGLHHILVFHGDQDRVVPFSDGRKIFEKAAFPKKMIVQKAGDHGVSNAAHRKQFIAESVVWFQKHLL